MASTPTEIATSNPNLHYRFEAKDDGLFLTAVTGSPPNSRIRSQRIDIVIGSGKKGQTYLWWRDNELFQLPLSYWTELGQWAANPGFSDRTADFTRPVIPRCLDCHATFFAPGRPAADTNQYDRATVLLGISCEKCHGPAAAHVAARRTGARTVAGGRDVVNPARLSRDQKIDLCASCHGGQKQGPPFSFLPGDRVNRASVALKRSATSDAVVNAGVDSHGQQATALMSSRCFQESAMTCETCHEPHAPQRDLVALSARCTSCHKPDACGRFKQEGRAIVGRCVDCHMPLQRSGMIVSSNAAGTAQAQLRSHVIAVYPTAR